MKLEKLRITNQREVILNELRAVKSHPTADELYTQVRRRLPRVSLATVYRNLEWLSEQGLARKIEVGGRQKRFDGDISDHYHVRCQKCGRVADVEMDTLDNPEGCISQAFGFTVTGHRLEFTGLCAQCSNGSSC
jgi:Fur family ferric uptake transcriptional regulator